MNHELLIIFIIILLALILCSFLGGNQYFEGMTNNADDQIHYGPNGSTAQVTKDGTLVITYADGTTSVYNNNANVTTASYNGPNGSTAKFQTNADGTTTILITTANGEETLYTTSTSNGTTSNGTNGNASGAYDNYNHYSGTSTPNLFYGPNGGTARVIQTPNNNTLVITDKNGTTDIYYINNNAPTASASASASASYHSPKGGSAKLITDNAGKTAVEITTTDGTKLVYHSDNVYTYNNNNDDTLNHYSADTNKTGADYNTAYDSSAYYAGSKGVTREQIPAGQEDLYILKSEIIPPVCPKCPDQIVKCPNSTDTSKCPPCPPCSRCPEPAFDCKKVPNYNSFNASYMPVPVLNSFSTFGM